MLCDGKKRLSTGLYREDQERACQALQNYLAQRWEAPQGHVRADVLLLEEVIAAYLKEHALKLENAHSRKHLANTGTRIVICWAGKTWAQVVGRRVSWRVAWNDPGHVVEALRPPPPRVSEGRGGVAMTLAQNPASAYARRAGNVG